MVRRVRISNRAARDLAHIKIWFTQPGAGERARNRLRAINMAIKELAHNPVMWPRGDDPTTRRRVVEGHTIVYSVENDVGDSTLAGDVDVLTIYGPGQSRE